MVTKFGIFVLTGNGSLRSRNVAAPVNLVPFHGGDLGIVETQGLSVASAVSNIFF
jgi:hypothetical protein